MSEVRAEDATTAPANTAAAVAIAANPPPRRASRIGAVLQTVLLLAGLSLLGIGLGAYYNVEEGGDVTAIKLTTKQGMVGQAAEAVANAVPSTPDLYLKVVTGSAGELELPVFKDMPIGNGLTWELPRTFAWKDVQRIEVFDHHWLRSDTPLDRITLGAGWSIDGQRFHVDLLGRKNEPPKWALPLAAVGGAITLLAVLRFLWTQVI